MSTDASSTTSTASAALPPMDDLWVEHVTGGERGYVDVFFSAYSGYWARGVLHEPALGWLAFERGSGDKYTTEEADEAVALWRAGAPLPPLWHRFDRAAAERAWACGVLRYGAFWFEDGDGPRYDAVLQRGLGVTCVIDGKTEARYG